MLKKTVEVPLKILTIDEDGFHPTIAVRINGLKAVLLIDTGASRTVFDKERIRHFIGKELLKFNEKLSTGLGTSSMETHTTLIRNFRIGKLLISDFNTVLLDLSHVNDSYAKLGLPAIDGVLGSDVLFRHQAVINFKKRVLSLRPPVSG